MSEVAIFGAGCFWGVEEKFRQLHGVIETEVGYCGGDLPDTDYKEVCTGTTNHAEVVKITFDSSLIKYEELLDVFWNSHNPTLLNRQGPDIGTQYRSVIFYTQEDQIEKAKNSMAKFDANGPFENPVVTQIVEVKNYVRGEEYHQKYLLKRGQTTCGL
ncbi:peptide-methionine (S)-S-oxide reductase MsrA [Bacteriovorax sp. DB6_IX]|uniref:peptide-methionine (S)-S-oxide reductase MsrA n=1 Tax=Bacteriovorax sp. DB6_IX TaxID=1353530 RepID=UPI000389F385|nr:peptide-methionine (S)-S-oxide reductase MsrA [Bacteriovorax sp. DB6_IX]EQC50716.1 peptide-methionine (S)-S-oxide reductase [Bacteriovorax sp. DB6_IX]